MPYEKPRRQPKRNYTTRVAGRFNRSVRSEKFNRLMGGFGKGLGGLYGELTKPGPAKKKGSKKTLSSGHMPGGKLMTIRRGQQLIRGLRTNRRNKILAGLRMDVLHYDPKRINQPNFPKREREAALKEIRTHFGNRLADLVKKRWEKLRAVSSGKEALSKLGGMSGFWESDKQGVRLIVEKYNQPRQVGRGARHFTLEKLEELINRTEKESGKSAAQAVRKTFLVTEVEEKSTEVKGTKNEKPIPFHQKRGVGISGFGRRAQRVNFNSPGKITPNAKQGNLPSSNRSTIDTKSNFQNSSSSKQPSIKK